MPCTTCVPDFYDHGWDQPDLREQYLLTKKEKKSDNEEEDLYDDEFFWATVCTDRQWGECECESGEITPIRWFYNVKLHGNGKPQGAESFSAPTSANIEKILEGYFPNYDIEYDDPWEGEKHLRMMEMGFYSNHSRR